MVFVKEESEENTSEPEPWRIKHEEPEPWRIKHEEPEPCRIKHEEPETRRIKHKEPETCRIKHEEPETWRIKHEGTETRRIKHEGTETRRIKHEEQGGKMLVQTKYNEQQKYVKLDCIEGRFDFMQFPLKVIERFCLPPDAKVIYNDATWTEVDAEIFSDLIGQSNVVLTVFSNDEFSDSLSSISVKSDNSNGSSASTVILDEVPNKRQRKEDTSAKQEHFYDAASNTGYIAWHMKTVHRKIRQGSLPRDSPRDVSPGGPKCQRATNFEEQLHGDACREAMSLLNHTTDKSLIFKKMRETFLHRQKLVKGSSAGSSADILSTFPRFLNTKGLVDQDFTLLFDTETSSRLLQKWDMFFRLSQLLLSAECPEGSDLHKTIYDQEMASLLLRIHLLPPSPGGLKSPKISACDAAERLVIFHKSCCSLEEHLNNNQRQHPYLLAVGRQKSKLDSFYIALDKHLIPCQANCSLGAFDELFKAHFVFNLSYDSALLHIPADNSV